MYVGRMILTENNSHVLSRCNSLYIYEGHALISDSMALSQTRTEAASWQVTRDVLHGVPACLLLSLYEYQSIQCLVTQAYMYVRKQLVQGRILESAAAETEIAISNRTQS